MMLYPLIALFIPREKQVGFLIIALGYLSLLLICVTLLIGPLNLLCTRRNPVKFDCGATSGSGRESQDAGMLR